MSAGDNQFLEILGKFIGGDVPYGSNKIVHDTVARDTARAFPLVGGWPQVHWYTKSESPIAGGHYPSSLMMGSIDFYTVCEKISPRVVDHFLRGSQIEKLEISEVANSGGVKTLIRTLDLSQVFIVAVAVEVNTYDDHRKSAENSFLHISVKAQIIEETHTALDDSGMPKGSVGSELNLVRSSLVSS